MNPRDQCLKDIRSTIASVASNLPDGFADGLSKQFENMLADDAWDDDDALPSALSLKAFLCFLICTKPVRRPGVGTNGRGSITAFWRDGENRFVIDFKPSGHNETYWRLNPAASGSGDNQGDDQ